MFLAHAHLMALVIVVYESALPDVEDVDRAAIAAARQQRAIAVVRVVQRALWAAVGAGQGAERDDAHC